jgi:hypothetical protein
MKSNDLSSDLPEAGLATHGGFSRSLPTLRGEPYQPSPRTVVVIGPGGGWGVNQKAYEHAMRSGWNLVCVQTRPDYDAYPDNWTKGVNADITSHGGKNHITFADHFVLPKIKELIAKGEGPAAVICGSRGSHCILPRLWALGWKGPTLCINAGVVNNQVRIPGFPCRLILMTMGETTSCLKIKISR